VRRLAGVATQSSATAARQSRFRIVKDLCVRAVAIELCKFLGYIVGKAHSSSARDLFELGVYVIRKVSNLKHRALARMRVVLPCASALSQSIGAVRSSTFIVPSTCRRRAVDVPPTCRDSRTSGCHSWSATQEWCWSRWAARPLLRALDRSRVRGSRPSRFAPLAPLAPCGSRVRGLRLSSTGILGLSVIHKQGPDLRLCRWKCRWLVADLSL